MNIIDTNGISKIFENDIDLQEEYWIPPDVAAESDLTQIIHGRKLSENIKYLDKYKHFIYSIYLNHYNKSLNSLGDRSFFNMTGFGDISIISALYTLVEHFDKMNRGHLFPLTENITVFTDDIKLQKKITKAFNRSDVVVKSTSEIA